MTDDRAEILLIEDNPDDVALMMEAFKSANLANTISVLRDGVEAIEFLLDNGSPGEERPALPKLILLDLKLPRLDGREVLKRLKADPRTRRVPVVVLTSSTEERDVMQSYECGANSYIVKPVDFEQFTEAVRDLGKYWLVINHDACC
jgi:two-component system, response regulator